MIDDSRNVAALPAPSPDPRRRQRQAMNFAVRHAPRLATFSTIGALVALLGFAQLALLVSVLRVHVLAAYLVQGAVSIEASYLANYRWTWRDSAAGFWPACWRFNLQKTLMTIPNLGLYALFIHIGVNYLVANVLVTAVFTVINYAFGHLWVFVPRRIGALDAADYQRGRAMQKQRAHDRGYRPVGARPGLPEPA